MHYRKTRMAIGLQRCLDKRWVRYAYPPYDYAGTSRMRVISDGAPKRLGGPQ